MLSPKVGILHRMNPQQPFLLLVPLGTKGSLFPSLHVFLNTCKIAKSEETTKQENTNPVLSGPSWGYFPGSLGYAASQLSMPGRRESTVESKHCKKNLGEQAPETRCKSEV